MENKNENRLEGGAYGPKIKPKKRKKTNGERDSRKSKEEIMPIQLADVNLRVAILAGNSSYIKVPCIILLVTDYTYNLKIKYTSEK